MFVEDKKKYLSLGSNLGDRFKNIEGALNKLNAICEIKRISPLYETKALLSDTPNENDDLFFLNLVIEIDTNKSPEDFLAHTKKIEQSFNNNKIQQWSPRYIDIDILTWDNISIKSKDLTIPHPEILKRSFVLDPLKDLDARWLQPARKLKKRNATIMKIYNITPDSFSGGLDYKNMDEFKSILLNEFNNGVSYFDFGAESTRPNATYVDEYKEWERLHPYINIFNNVFKNKILRPKLSIDTYKASIAKKSLQMGADLINDVSGLADPQMINVIKDSNCQYILMHSLGAPAQKENIICGDPVTTLCQWLESKLELFLKNNIPLKNIIFDPGIGFGKNTQQSALLIRHIDQFKKYPVRLLVGHSRKSFLTPIIHDSYKQRDLETIGVSLKLLSKGVDILRVHNTQDHLKVLKGWMYA